MVCYDPSHGEGRQWDTSILLLSYHDPAMEIEGRQWDTSILLLSKAVWCAQTYKYLVVLVVLRNITYSEFLTNPCVWGKYVHADYYIYGKDKCLHAWSYLHYILTIYGIYYTCVPGILCRYIAHFILIVSHDEQETQWHKNNDSSLSGQIRDLAVSN